MEISYFEKVRRGLPQRRVANQRFEGGVRIAQIAPLNESVPPALYGGTERVVSYLTEELVRQGHDACADGKTRPVSRGVSDGARHVQSVRQRPRGKAIEASG